ncbi:MAG: hypothetical protein ACO4AG_03620 [Candidatus Nanopelagicales bacterium]
MARRVSRVPSREIGRASGSDIGTHQVPHAPQPLEPMGASAIAGDTVG